MTGLWFARLADGPDPSARRIVALAGDEHADGSLVDISAGGEAEVLARALVTATVDALSGEPRHIAVASQLAPKAPALWYVTHPEPGARPPAMALIGFPTRHVADGTVVDQATFTDLPVRSDEQAGALRWWRTGQVHQIYVAPAQRRRGIATKLLAVAAVYTIAKGWPLLWGNGERTELGEVFVQQGHEQFPSRVLPRTRSLPPMTPPAAAAGLPDRLLRPDGRA